MALTVEPGLYIRPAADIPPALAGIGIRIEDDVLVTATGFEGHHRPKTVAEIEESCAMTEPQCSPPTPVETDVLIVGAGPVGMTLQLALTAGGLAALVADRRPAEAPSTDPRALALSHGARELLEQIDAWPARAATPIETIHVSQRGGFGRTVIDRADHGLPALGYVVRYRDLPPPPCRACPPAPRSAAGSWPSNPATITRRHPRQDDRRLTVRTRLLVHAEGTRRRFRRHGERLPATRRRLRSDPTRPRPARLGTLHA